MQAMNRFFAASSKNWSPPVFLLSLVMSKNEFAKERICTSVSRYSSGL